MKNFEEIEHKFLHHLDDFCDDSMAEAILSFSQLWTDMDAYTKHIKKRIRNQDIENEQAYLLKTFEVLAYTQETYIESYPLNQEIWDRVFYNHESQWAVILGGNGKILTSYKITGDIIKTLEQHKKLFQSTYTRKVVSNAFSKRTQQIYERLANL